MTLHPAGLHHLETVMGMVVSIDLRDPDVPPSAVDRVVDWLHHVDRTFSTYDDRSPITAIGRGALPSERMTAEIRQVLDLCEEMRAETGGAFDPFDVPAPNGTRFDPSGLVKGWAVERAAGMLEDLGCRSFFLNAGGDIALRGRPDPSLPWRVGIRHPRRADALAAVVEGSGRLAVATSAQYERGDHIVDPRTGSTPDSLLSATVVGPDLTVADAFATAVFVMGVDGLRWLEGYPAYEAYLITSDDMTVWTPGFARYRAPRDDDDPAS